MDQITRAQFSLDVTKELVSEIHQQVKLWRSDPKGVLLLNDCRTKILENRNRLIDDLIQLNEDDTDTDLIPDIISSTNELYASADYYYQILRHF